MDFRGFYDNIIFDVDKPILRKYTGKQGDTKSRGLYVTVTQRNVVIKDLTGLSMRLFYEKPDKTRGFIDGVVDGDKFRIDYTNQMFAVPGVVWAELRLMGADGEVITSKAFKILVDSSIADGSIISKDERGILDRAFELAEDIIPRLELLDVELLEDVQNEMLQSQLKVAKVEKELNDYKATMQQINIHQSPTQKASGHGIVSLSKNAAEGQVSASVKGQTYLPRNYLNLAINGDFENGFNGWSLTNSQAISIDSTKSFKGNFSANINIDNEAATYLRQDCTGNVGDKWYVSVRYYKTSGSNALVALLPKGAVTGAITTILDTETFNSSPTGVWLHASGTGVSTNDGITVLLGRNVNGETYNVNFDDIVIINMTKLGIEGKSKEEMDSFVNSAKSTLCAFRIRSVSQDESQESAAYVLAKDAEEKIVELHSLPNDTKDEINVTDRKLIKRIGEKSNIANGMVIDFADMAEGGIYYAWNDDGETETGVKGNTLGIDATKLIYQLAMPVETPVQVSGSLVSYPSGTVYIEPFVADAGIYTDKMSVLHQDLPIKTLEKLSKIDFTTGLETELDVSNAVISKDRLSFTHPDLVDGDVVFYTYEYDRESTEGEAEIEYYDSRYVVKDSVTGKFYKWQITVANGVPSIELKEV